MKILNKIKFKFRINLLPYQDLLSEIQPNKDILDIGCGTGSILKLISQSKNPTKLGGIEISRGLVNECRENLKKIYPAQNFRIELFDGYNIPNFCKSYSQVLVIDVLHHIPHNKKILFLKNLHKSLSTGVIIVIKDIDSSNKFLLLFNKFHDLLSSGSFGFEISAQQTINLLKESGFKLIKNYPSPKLVYAHHFYICTT